MDAHVSFSGWQYSVCAVKQQYLESKVIPDSMGADNWKLHNWYFFGTLPYVSFHLTEFNLYPSTVVKRNCEYNSSMNSTSPSGELSNLKVVLETLELATGVRSKARLLCPTP